LAQTLQVQRMKKALEILYIYNIIIARLVIFYGFSLYLDIYYQIILFFIIKAPKYKGIQNTSIIQKVLNIKGHVNLI